MAKYISLKNPTWLPVAEAVWGWHSRGLKILQFSAKKAISECCFYSFGSMKSNHYIYTYHSKFNVVLKALFECPIIMPTNERRVILLREE